MFRAIYYVVMGIGIGGAFQAGAYKIMVVLVLLTLLGYWEDWRDDNRG